MKTVSCRDVGMNCDWKTNGKDEEEVLHNVREHVEKDHQMKMEPQLTDQVRSKIHETQAA